MNNPVSFYNLFQVRANAMARAKEADVARRKLQAEQREVERAAKAAKKAAARAAAGGTFYERREDKERVKERDRNRERQRDRERERDRDSGEERSGAEMNVLFPNIACIHTYHNIYPPYQKMPLRPLPAVKAARAVRTVRGVLLYQRRIWSTSSIRCSEGETRIQS